MSDNDTYPTVSVDGTNSRNNEVTIRRGDHHVNRFALYNDEIAPTAAALADASGNVLLDEEMLAEFVIFNALEEDAIDIYVPDGVEDDQVRKGVSVENVDKVTASDEHIEVTGEFTVRRHVRTIPASGGGKLEPPTNPPEAVFEDQPMFFAIHYYLEDHGYGEGRVDVL